MPRILKNFLAQGVLRRDATQFSLVKKKEEEFDRLHINYQDGGGV